MSQHGVRFLYRVIGGSGTQSRVVRDVMTGSSLYRKDEIGSVFDGMSVALLRRHQLPGRMWDLLELAAAVALVDRFSPRNLQVKMDGQIRSLQRTLHLDLEVRDLEFWECDGVVSLLSELLGWMTSDTWRFSFRQRQDRWRVEKQLVINDYGESSADQIALFGGGLDSLAGIASLIESYGNSRVFGVTTVLRPKIGSAVKSLREAITRFEGGICVDRFVNVPVPVRWFASTIKANERESSLRARNLLYLAVGAVSAYQRDQSTLFLYENGIGALSLPMIPEHVGNRSSKGAHPKTLRLASQLFRLIFNQDVKIENIGVFETKGDALARILASEALNPIAIQTQSCDRTRGLPRGASCGRCSSCLLRLSAFRFLGIDDDGTMVNSPGDKAGHLIPMMLQVERFRRELSEAEDIRLLDSFLGHEVFPYLDLDLGIVATRLGGMGSRYVAEMDHLQAWLIERANAAFTRFMITGDIAATVA